MADRIDFAIAEYNRAIDDYTSLGRWAWGIAVTFSTSVLFNSVDKQIIGTPNRVAQSIILVVVAVAVLVVFVARARRRVKLGRQNLNGVEMHADPRAIWFLNGGVHDNSGWCVMVFRLMPAALILVTYWFMIDDVVCKSANASTPMGRLFSGNLCRWLPRD